MQFKAALLSAVLASTASSAVLPRIDVKPGEVGTGEIMHTMVFGTQDGSPITAEYVNATDNVWKKVQLGIPLQVFGRSSDYIWISTNGIVSIDEPAADCHPVPGTPLPAGPDDAGCLPKNVLMPFWNDMALRPGAFDTHVKLILAWHPQAKDHLASWYHYHLEWQLCEKGVVEGVVSEKMPCGDATRTVYTSWGIGSVPNMIGFDYYFPKADKPFSNSGTIGIQSYPKSLTIPLSEVSSKPTRDREVVILYFDTVNFTHHFIDGFVRPW
ncbi:hypothetical protein Dda_6814 [Drechslerella dactyloides]|uniref:Uncharacterized protein n=1 Tax=Drechslerella dactyloides TaxID=74499 RepID=A0AAD6NGI7_DREDA|nr:hypothetical protein Dda_6814 [Drechslerella dactyloides]